MNHPKFPAIAMIFCLVISLLGCGKGEVSETTAPATEPSSTVETTMETTIETTFAEAPSLPEELAAFDQVFNGTRAITRAASGESIMLSRISLFFTVEELPWGVAQVAVLDLDGDSILEAVLEVENYAGYVILAYQDGVVLGTEIWYRAFQELKADGSFMGSGSSFNRYYWQYHLEGNSLLAECYEEEGSGPYYSLSGEETDAEAFAAFEAIQQAKPAAIWYPSWQDYLASR